MDARGPLIAASILLVGCTHQQRQRVEPAAPTPTPPSTPEVARPPAPTLAEERQAQAKRAGDELSKKIGMQVEQVQGAPGWYKGPGAGLGRGRAATLPEAYQQAARMAIGQNRGATLERAAYARLDAGEFVAWAAVKGSGNGSATPAPVAASTATPAHPATSVPPPASPAPASAPAAAPNVPAWFSPAAKEANGRVTLGASADAPTVREAPRMATEAARAALAQVMGVEPADVRLESTFVRKEGNGYRAFVLVSAPGTIRR